MRDRVKERDNWNCVTCGTKDNLTIHHRDGDHKNNTLENLVTLCKECHDRIHARRKQNKRERTRLKQQLKNLVQELSGHPDTEIQTALVTFANLNQTAMDIVGIITTE